IQHTAIDERYRSDIDVSPRIVLKILIEKGRSARPRCGPLPQHLIYLQNPRRRKETRDRGSRSCGESQAWSVVLINIAFGRTACPAPIFEMKRVSVLALMNDWRIMNLYELLTPMKVSHADEKVQPLTRGDERRCALARLIHRCHRVIH